MATLSNDSQRKVVQGTASDDYISNTGAYATIYGNGGNDTISNNDISHWSVLDGGAGNDKISSEQGNNLTIIGGLGNDTINFKSLYSNNHVIQYNSGDGDDYIEDTWGNPNATLEIGGGSGNYFTLQSGSDIVVRVGEGKITIAGGENYSGFIISGVEKDYRDITLTEGNDSYYNTITLEGAASLSALNIAGVYNNPYLITGSAAANSISNTLSGATIQSSIAATIIFSATIQVTATILLPASRQIRRSKLAAAVALTRSA